MTEFILTNNDKEILRSPGSGQVYWYCSQNGCVGPGIGGCVHLRPHYEIWRDHGAFRDLIKSYKDNAIGIYN